MKLNLSKERAFRGCEKPACKGSTCYRHHRGGEHTFVRHFDWMLRSPVHRARYLEFCRIYHSFRAGDVVNICGNHHEEVHDKMEAFDLDWMVANNCIKSFKRFTWDQAMKLVKARQAFTDEWLKEQTPGMRQRRFTNRP